ncbi:MAG: hypothetical protein ACI4GW_04790 [Lachnospiraceae bacterium]
MKKEKEKIIKRIEYYSHSQRRKRKLEAFEQECKRLRRMDDSELEFEYITTKTEYEHNKNVFSLIVLTLLLSILVNVWSKFFEFANKVIDYSNTLVDDKVESAKIILFITIGIALFISFIILFCLYTRLTELRNQKMYMTMVEEIRNKRKMGVHDERKNN